MGWNPKRKEVSTIKNIISLLAALMLMFCLSGCGIPFLEELAASPESPAQVPPASSQAAPAPIEVLRLPWFTQDSLNPYSCESLQNYCLSGLLYDPLVALDSANNPVNRLALEIDSGNPAVYVITLRSDAVFSDGGALTSEDILYSLELARNSPRFAAGLKGIVTAEAQNQSTVVITLAQPDIYFARSLSFPVLRSGTGEFPVPVGVGRFVAHTEDSRFLRNDSYYNPVKTIREISLVETASLEEQSYAIMEGKIDLMYSDLQSDLNLGLGISYRQIPLSNMVYLGVNTTRQWADGGTVQAISGLIRREDIARRAYTGFATITSLPINPVTTPAALDVSDLEVNLDRQKALLETAGWSEGEDGIRRRLGAPLSLELLVNAESSERLSAAELISANCAQAGVQLKITSLPFEEYQTRIALGEYDLCIAEMKTTYNMDISVLSTLPMSSQTLEKYNQVKSGAAELIQLEEQLRKESLVIPILFRRGILGFSRDFSANIVATEQDIFYNIVEW